MTAFIKPLTWALGVVLTITGILGFFNDPVLGILKST